MEQAKAIDPEIKEGKIFAVVGYWGFLCILPLMLDKENKFAVYHGKQGLVLFICLVAGFMFNIIPGVGNLVYRLVLFLYLIFLLWGTIQALRGVYARLPIISDIADKIIL
jgi:uncharacterized membrane protein